MQGGILIGAFDASNVRMARYQQNISKKLNHSQNVLSSGRRIVAAKDDSAGLSISTKLRVRRDADYQASRNIQETISMLQTAEGGMQATEPLLQRMRTLAVQAANGTLIDSDRDLLDMEFDELKDEINQIAFNTEYNTIELLGPVDKPKADIVFLLDDSGSCGAEIDSVRSNLQSWITDLTHTFSDINVASASYGTTASIDQDLTDDVDAVNTAMNARGATGTGEFMYNGIDEIINNITWTEGYDRHIIALTDAGAQDEETVQASRAATLAALQNDNITFSTIDPGGDADGTGGWTEGGFTLGPTTTIGASSYDEFQEYDYLTEGTNGTRGTFASINTALSTIRSAIEANAQPQMDDPYVLNIGPSPVTDSTTTVLPFDNRASNYGVNGSDISTRTNALNAMNSISTAINTLSRARAQVGAAVNAFKHKVNFLNVQGENLTQAYSRILDADMADEVINLSKQNMLNQTSMAMAAQAKNIMSSTVLSVIDLNT